MSGPANQPTIGSSTNWLRPVILRTRFGLGRDRRGEASSRSSAKSTAAITSPTNAPIKLAAHHASPVILRKAAVATTMNSDSGRKTFQPSRISWS